MRVARASRRAGRLSTRSRSPPAGEAPADFDAFWADQKKKLAAVKPNVKLTPESVPAVGWGPPVETFEIQMDCLGGKPVRGYFARPAKAKKRSRIYVMPAVLSLHSAGIRSASRQAAWNGAKRGTLSMDINAHGVPNGKDAQFYKDLGLNELKGYSAQGIGSRETFYFLGMYLRMVRAIDFLTSQPEWDGKNVIVRGLQPGRWPVARDRRTRPARHGAIRPGARLLRLRRPEQGPKGRLAGQDGQDAGRKRRPSPTTTPATSPPAARPRRP